MQDILYSILTALATALTSAIVGVVIYGIKKIGTWLATKVDNEKSKNIINDITSTIQMAVQDTYQSFVENLKKSGSFDSEKQKEALNMAKNKILDLLSTEGKDYIVQTYGDIEKWITSKIESVIYVSKNGQTSNTNAVNEVK